MDFFRLLYSQSILFLQVKYGEISPFLLPLSLFQWSVNLLYSITSMKLFRAFNIVVFWFNVQFSVPVFESVTNVWISTSEIHKFHNRTNVCVIFKRYYEETFPRAFFYSVYVIVKGVRWCERNGFTRRRRVFMRLQLCSSLSGLHVTPLKSRVLWQTCKVLCLDASEVLSSPTYFRGCFRKSDTYKTLTLQDIQFTFQI